MSPLYPLALVDSTSSPQNSHECGETVDDHLPSNPELQLWFLNEEGVKLIQQELIVVVTVAVDEVRYGKSVFGIE